MLKDIQITLYDLFGYLLPGGISVLSSWIVIHTVLRRQEPLVLWGQELPAQALAAVLVVAYLFGHLGHGMGNILQKLAIVNPDKSVSMDAVIDQSVRAAVSARFNIKVDGLKIHQLYELCDEALLHHGSLGEREIFTYREGFYRGNAVALSFLTIATLLLVSDAPIRVQVAAGIVDVGLFPLLLASAVTALGAFLAFVRYKRFAHYRITRCLLRFLALTSKS